MELKDVIEEAQHKTGLSQNKIAERIGLTHSNLSSVLAGRRRLPAEAAIELFDLTGIHPREILRAAVKTAACFLLGVVLYTTGPEKAKANQGVTMTMATDYTLSRFRHWLRTTAKALKEALRPLAGRGMLATT